MDRREPQSTERKKHVTRPQHPLPWLGCCDVEEILKNQNITPSPPDSWRVVRSGTGLYTPPPNPLGCRVGAVAGSHCSCRLYALCYAMFFEAWSPWSTVPVVTLRTGALQAASLPCPRNNRFTVISGKDVATELQLPSCTAVLSLQRDRTKRQQSHRRDPCPHLSTEFRKTLQAIRITCASSCTQVK